MTSIVKMCQHRIEKSLQLIKRWKWNALGAELPTYDKSWYDSTFENEDNSETKMKMQEESTAQKKR